MRLSDKYTEDFRLAREVAVVDVWDLDDRVTQLENLIDRCTDAIERLERINERFIEFYIQERRRQEKVGNKGFHDEGNRGRYRRKNKSL